MAQSRLLSLVEMRTPALSPPPPPPTPEQRDWLATHHYPIRSLMADQDFSDLAFLRQELSGRRIVQLGESSHGSREFGQIKVRLIKYLHEHLGYDVLAFESSLVGCHSQGQLLAARVADGSDEGYCMFGVWHTLELQELFRYLRSTQNTARPLRLTGFDLQSSGSFDKLSKIERWMLPTLDLAMPDAKAQARAALKQLDHANELGAACSGPEATGNCDEFEALRGRAAADLLPLSQALQKAETAAQGQQRSDFAVADLALQSWAKRLEKHSLNRFRADPVGRQKSSDYRDQTMAESLSGLAERVYPQDKIIVWAHNYHIMEGASENVLHMGQLVSKRWGPELYSIGLFMLRGASAGNTRTPIDVLAPAANSIEALAYSLRLGALFLPLSTTDASGSGDDWMHTALNYLYWGSYLDSARLDSHFDALIVIDKSSLPQYLY